MREPTDSLPPVLRDLYWAISSPPPITLPDGFPWPDERALLGQMLSDPAQARLLAAEIEPCRQQRLGPYFEALWLAWLRHHPHWQLRLHHLPIRSGGRTLGEIDLVVENAARELIHLELAVKFYLRVPASESTDALAQWMGPGLKDTLARKHRHLLQHQLPLGRHPQVISALGRAPDQHAMLLRGRFFQPWSGQPQDLQQAPVWMTLGDCGQIPVDRRILTLERKDWLTGPDRIHWLPGPDWQQQMADMTRPVQVWIEAPEQASGQLWAFVVPDSWPRQARQLLAADGA
ncbi:DUF1853 family protein [Natronospirillum operosum]|uniref:DUF1853 family protein n=1 Tax=Natronospirillum operosum TaxID=2759953 RepID=A0A4Z0WIN9_9GAMM|nr:DUF1853 family protein [Natronospirillum operosum]TGG95727.1 DUF1853 family protein [Natronospirillum operosum]